ncbi:hypothetical protein COS61_00010 [Candidatus Wolfebacteria bacterium CG03_land_8_20_14_0_80_40_12]|uniref:Uncharacterized protein n=1 Tax=Candidatus Wolfebacteria bacterium CG03_land_8_20_14_0_80_40_12 TaxID=1975069 RepID=A0A2M7B6H3_9BACT|nr:MAG: hypothetical protein COS61_00010 [Candidatus Wolfebacteria bacterium CG03_land_8_20_14_0_80_40_12]
MKNVEKIEENKGEFNNKEQESEKLEKKPEKQIIEGLIGKYDKDWQKKLPAGINPKMVDLFIGKDGLHYWHLKSSEIEDEEEKRKYGREKEIWET